MTTTTDPWIGHAVRVRPGALNMKGQPHHHAGARGTVLNVPRAGKHYSVRLACGTVANIAEHDLVHEHGGQHLRVPMPGWNAGPIADGPSHWTRLQAAARVERSERDAYLCNATARGLYTGIELAPSVRPGAEHADALPSRRGNTLFYRDGRVEALP